MFMNGEVCGFMKAMVVCGVGLTMDVAASMSSPILKLCKS